MVGGTDIRVDEKLSRVLIGPIFRNSVALLGIIFNMLNNFLEGAVVLDQVVGSGWADLGNLVEIVAAKENAEVDKLLCVSLRVLLRLWKIVT